MSKTVKEVVGEYMYKAPIRNITIIEPDRVITGLREAFVRSETKNIYKDMEVEKSFAVGPGYDYEFPKGSLLYYEDFEKYNGHDLFIFTKENANHS